MKKKLFRWLIALAVVLPCLLISASAASGSVVAFGFCGGEGNDNNLEWTLYSDGELTISGTGAMADWSSTSDVPWYGNRGSISKVTIGNGVTSIGNNSFSGCARLIKVAIPGSVESIGSYAFYSCVNLTTATIPDGVVCLGDYAFYGCTSLTTATIPDSVLWIGSYVFYGCEGLTTATISDNMESIGAYAFCRCTGLTSVIIPSSVTSIGGYAFYDCEGLTTVTIGSGVTSVGESLFSGCTSLSTVTFARGAVSIWDHAFYGCASLTSVTIPSSVTSIGDKAFYGCAGLTKVTIPSSVTSIGDYAFYDCAGLTAVEIPSSVTSIGYHAFRNCTGLTKVIIENGVSNVGHYAFYGCTGVTAVDVPDSVISIGVSAFAGCTGLNTVTIGSGVRSIGQGVFSDCSSLTSITVDQDNTAYSSVDGILFNEEQTELVRYAGTGDVYVIPSGVTSVGYHAFRSCAGLTAVTIPASVASIGEDAFYNCSDLARVEFFGDAPSGVSKDTFENCAGSLTIYCCYGMAGWTDSENYDTESGTWYDYPLEVVTSIYTVTVANTANGTVHVDTTSGMVGTVVTITAIPDEGYGVKEILVDGVAISGRTFTIYGDHTVTVTFVELPPFYGANMVLGGTLDMNFFFARSNVTDPGSYAKVVRSYGDGGASDVQIIPKSQWETNNAYYKIVYKGMAAKEMCDEINITIYDSNDAAISRTWTDSVRDYVMRMVDRADLKNARTMLIDMLNYGAAAQKNFKYATTDLANCLLTEAHQADATKAAVCEDQRVKTDKVYGTSLELENKIVLNFYFTGVTNGMYAQIEYTGHYGKKVSYRAEYTDFVKNNSTYKLSVDGLAVADGNTLVTCTVYNADGSQYASVTDSVNSYLARFKTEHPWMEYVVRFISSTYNYLHATDAEDGMSTFVPMDGDRIRVHAPFNAADGKVNATILSSSNPDAYEGWICLVKFDKVTDTAAGYYQVENNGTTITLKRLEVVFADNVYAGYRDEEWLNAHIGDELLVVEKEDTVSAVKILNVYYKVPEGVVLYMAENPQAYLNTGNGAFYVVDNAGNTCLAVGEKHFFTFDKDYFYTTNEDVEAARVFCYGWQDGKLLTTSAMGVRKGISLETDYLHPSDSEGVDTFGAVDGSLYNGYLGYHRVVRWKDLRDNPSTDAILTTKVTGGYVMSAVKSCIYSGGITYNCGGIHGIIGSCFGSGHSHDFPNYNMSITNAVFVDTRTDPRTRITSVEEFVTQATEAGQTKGEELVINYISAGKSSAEIAYVVITDLTYPLA